MREKNKIQMNSISFEKSDEKMSIEDLVNDQKLQQNFINKEN